MDILLHTLASIIIQVISYLGYGGILGLMALESACVPIPSEIIMPFSGYLVMEGKFNFIYVILMGVLGNLIGSIIAYLIGINGGRKVIEKYGKYILISVDDLNRAEKWFYKYGAFAVLFSRCMPVIRTFISFPAGISRMNFLKFCVYTFIGCVPWCFILTYSGVIMGENWNRLEVYFHKFDLLIGIIIIFGIGWWIWRHVRSCNM